MFEIYYLATSRDYVLISLGVLISIVEALAEPASVIIVGKVFRQLARLANGKISQSEFMSHITNLTLGIVGIAGIVWISGWLAYIVWMSVGYRQGHLARLKLYKFIVHRKVEWFDSVENLAGLTVMYYKDIQDLEVAAGMATCEIISMAISLGAHIAVAFYYSWAVTLISFCGIPILVFVGAIFSPLVEKKVTEQKSLLERANAHANWVLSALQTVKIFQKERREWRHFHQDANEIQKTATQFWLLFNMQMGFARFIVLSMFVQSFYFGYYMVHHHGLSAGAVVSVFWSCLSAAGVLQALMQHLLEWQRGMVSAKRLRENLAENAAANLRGSIGLYPEAATEGHILFQNVVFSYPNRAELVLADATLEFEAGQTTFVIGKSGCGKSTIASLITRQYLSSAGEIAIDGHSVELLSPQWIQDNVYVVEQSPKIFDIPLGDNIRLASKQPEEVSDADIMRALGDVCAQDFVLDLPLGLQTPGSFAFSGGQRQRIALARARICDAPITVFDESTSALDKTLQSQVISRILSWRQGKTTILITHDMSIIPIDYPVCVMEDGQSTCYESVKDIHDVFALRAQLTKEEPDSPSEISDDEDAKVSWSTHVAKVEQLGVEDRSNKLVASLKKAWYDFSGVNIGLVELVPNKPLFVISLGATVANAVVNPIFAFAFSKLLLGIVQPHAKRITMWALIVLLCAFLDGVTSFCKVTANMTAEQTLRVARESLYDKLLAQRTLSRDEVAYYSKLLVNDTEKCGLIIGTYWPGLLTMVVLGLTGFIWSIVAGTKLTLVAISIVPAFVITSQGYKLLLEYWNGRREAERAQIVGLMCDIASGFRTLKITRREQYFSRYYYRREQQLVLTTRKMTFWIGCGYGLAKVFPYAMEALLLWYGMHLISLGKYTVQNTMTIFALLMFTLITIDQLVAGIGSVGTGFEAVKRLIAALHFLRPEPSGVAFKQAEPSDWRDIEFLDVGIEYPNGSRILGGFTHKVHAGSAVAILGPSGIGKSAVARMMEKFEEPTVGHILIGGEDLQDLATADVRRHVALVGQMPLDFFEDTIFANLRYALDDGVSDPAAQELIYRVCKTCGVDDFVSRIEDGYETKIKNGLLSGGQMQRLGIARALLRDPKVLILDECTSTLDPENQALVLNLVRELKEKRDKSILIITHKPDFAAVADELIHL